jgi:hypothetical protein
MEPLTLVYSALVAGASAALKPTAELAVKEAYQALKSLVLRKLGRAEVEMLERDPADETRRKLVKQELERAGPLAEREVLEQAQATLVAVKRHDPEAATAAGITLADLAAAGTVNIERLVAAGAVSVARVTAGGDLNIRDLAAGNPTRR